VTKPVRALAAPPHAADTRVHHWHASHLLGRQFSTEAEVDDVLQVASDEIKAKIRDGFTVIAD